MEKPTQEKPIQISIHASEKEATALSGHVIAVIDDFNPRLREGGDMTELIVKMGKLTISIHASEKEATERN